MSKPSPSSSNPMGYISCIKIKGVPILPPLITPELRDLLLNYKKQAIETEKRIKERRQEIQEDKTPTPLVEENTNLAIPGSVLCDKEGRSENVDIKPPVKENELKDVALTVPSNKKTRIVNLTSEIVELSDYRPNNRVQVMNDCDSSHTKEYNNNTKSNYIVINYSLLETDSDSSDDKLSQVSSHRRLIRSNSYTIDTPSEALLAHIEKQAASNEELKDNASEIDDTLNLRTSSMSINECSQIQNSSSSVATDPFDSILIPLNANNDNKEDCETKQVSNADTNPEIIRENYLKSVLCQQSSNLESEQQMKETGPSIQSNINVLSNIILQEIIENGTESKISDTDLLNKIVTTELPKHNQESSLKFETLQESESDDQDFYVTPEEHTPGVTNDDLITINTFHNTELCCHVNVNSAISSKSKNLTFTIDRERREHAASVICAAVKGYLTRRLLKTEKVQNYIKTIQESILCAVDVQTSKDLNESDVELHRRLINQVEAAYIEFYDTFFLLTIPEQMSIITADRIRKKEKSKRPPSARSGVSSRSNSAKSKSLTESFNKKGLAAA